MHLMALFFFFFLLPNSAFAEVKTIELKHRPAFELLEPVRELLDDGEKAQAADNTLILIADGDSLLAAEKLVTLLDRQLLPLVVRFRMSQQQQRVGQAISTEPTSHSTSQLSTGNSGARRLGNSSNEVEQSLRVVEGSGGWLEIGKEVPYKQQWSAYTGIVSGYAEKVAYKTVATGFWVQPVQVIGKSVLVDFEPQINQLAGQKNQGPPKIRFSQLRSRLQLPLGEWYPVGEHLQQHNQVNRDIISWRTSNGESEQFFYLRIDPAAGFSP